MILWFWKSRVEFWLNEVWMFKGNEFWVGYYLDYCYSFYSDDVEEKGYVYCLFFNECI